MHRTATRFARFAVRALGLLLGVCSGMPAHGGLVGAGQTVSVSVFDFQPPTGTLLEQKTSSFSVPYGSPQPSVGFGGQLAGTLHSAVYRDAGGTLSFLYDIDLANANGVSAAEGSRLAVQSFGPFKTNVSGGLDFEDLSKVSRSTSGAKITLFSDSPGLGGPPMLVVRTNATSYNGSGSATFAASDEISMLDGSSKLVSGSATIDNVFEPTSAAGPVTPPVSIPLPPAFYSGVGVLLATGLIATTRRAWQQKG